MAYRHRDWAIPLSWWAGRACIQAAQVFVANEDAQPGDTISYGEKIVLLHRAAQKFIVKSKIGLGDGFRAHLETVSPLPGYIKAKLEGTEEEENDDAEEAKAR